MIGKHLIDEPDRERLLRLQAAAGVCQLAHVALGDQLAQTRKRADIRRHAEVDLLDLEERVRRAIADIAGRRHVDSATDTATLDRNQHRHACVVEARETILQAHHMMTERFMLGRAVRSMTVKQRIGRKHRQIHAGRKVLARR